MENKVKYSGTKAVAKVKPKRSVEIIHRSPAELIQSAVMTKGGTIENLREMLAIQKEYEANEAKKAYTSALSAFKCEVPHVGRDRTNKQYNNKYSSKGNLLQTITPVLSKFGFSVSFSYANSKEGTDHWVNVTCILTHQLGHSESNSFSAPMDVSGAKNPIQGLKSTTTYLEKLLFAGILGIESTEERDDDGAASGGPAKVQVGKTGIISDKELSNLRDLMIDAEANEKAFIGLLKVAKLEDLPKEQLDFAKKTLANIKASHKT
jgi:hypothetical protein